MFSSFSSWDKIRIRIGIAIRRLQVWKDQLQLRNKELPDGYLHILVNVGDAGPDQVGFRSSLHTLFTRDDYKFVLFFSLACLKHQFHLAARGQLSLMDTCLRLLGKRFKYFTSVATMSHSWRGHLKKVRSQWEQLHSHDGKLGNKEILFRVPPVAIAGRWASIDSAPAENMNQGLPLVP